MEKATKFIRPSDRPQSPRISNASQSSWRETQTRHRSRNYSRPSPPSSMGSIDRGHMMRRRRSSDDIPDRAQISRGQTPPDFNPQETPASPASTRVPVYAQRAVQSAMLHNPPPIPPDTPTTDRRSRKSLGSTDVVDAAKSLPPPSHWSSTRSLTSMIREKADQEPSTFAQRVFEAGKPDLLYDLRTSKRLKDQRHGVLDLTTLQRMSQHVLQQKLVEQVKAIGDQGAWMEIGVRQTLHEYCKRIPSQSRQWRILTTNRHSRSRPRVYGTLCVTGQELRPLHYVDGEASGVQITRRSGPRLGRPEETGPPYRSRSLGLHRSPVTAQADDEALADGVHGRAGPDCSFFDHVPGCWAAGEADLYLCVHGCFCDRQNRVGSRKGRSGYGGGRGGAGCVCWDESACVAIWLMLFMICSGADGVLWHF